MVPFSYVLSEHAFYPSLATFSLLSSSLFCLHLFPIFLSLAFCYNKIDFTITFGLEWKAKYLGVLSILNQEKVINHGKVVMRPKTYLVNGGGRKKNFKEMFILPFFMVEVVTAETVFRNAQLIHANCLRSFYLSAYFLMFCPLFLFLGSRNKFLENVFILVGRTMKLIPQGNGVINESDVVS